MLVKTVAVIVEAHVAVCDEPGALREQWNTQRNTLLGQLVKLGWVNLSIFLPAISFQIHYLWAFDACCRFYYYCLDGCQAA